MTTTPNLHLPQWEKTDRIMMDDFNDAMSKIDAGVKAANDVAAAAPRIVTGTYAGNGAASRTISLGFTPKAVILMERNGLTVLNAGNWYYHFGGIALANAPCTTYSRSRTIFSIQGNGIQVGYARYDDGYEEIDSNANGRSYYYIAIG